jgi:hypothetical protein
MNIYIYICLLILLIIYIYKNQKENFTQDDLNNNNYDGTNQYDVLDTNKVRPVLTENTVNTISGFDSNDHGNSDKHWFVKNQGFSDIYNYEDVGGAIIYGVANDLNVVIYKPQDNNDNNNITKNENNIIPQTMSYNNSTFKLLGIATNSYYNQYYYIFEKLATQQVDEPLLEEELKYMKQQVYEYLLVKMHNNSTVVEHWVAPRNKVNIGDVIYFSMGTFQLGPLSIDKL